MELEVYSERHDYSSCFDRTCDELFSEILNKLPIKTIHICKSVSKRWCNLISTEHFITSYIRHKKTSNEIPSFCLFYQNTFPYDSLMSLVYSSNNTISLFYATAMLFEPPGFSLLSPLSFEPSITVLSSSNGLVLCSNALISQTRYYVCNPLTKCRVSISPPPSAGLKRAHIGFLCKGMDFSSVSASCGFIIVRIPNYGKEMKPFIFKIETYDSEYGQWDESELDGDWRHHFERFMYCPCCPFQRVRHTAVVCKGLLHWRGHDCVFVYDPFYSNDNNDDGHCIIVQLPRKEYLPNTFVDHFLGECKGHLMYTRFQNRIFTVWQLKDYNKGDWCLLHNVPLNQMVFDQPNLVDRFMAAVVDFSFLAFHPFDEDVFICIGGLVQLWHMHEKTIKNICYVSNEGRCINYSMAYLVVLPWWPLSLGSCL